MSTVNEHDSEAYCKSCYARNFGTKGYGFAGGAAGGLAGNYDGEIDYSAHDNEYNYDEREDECRRSSGYDYETHAYEH